MLAVCTRSLTDTGAADEAISPSLAGQQAPSLTCASSTQLGSAAADTGASAAGKTPFMTITFDIAISVAALGGARARALQGADDALGVASVLGGGPVPAALSPQQRALLQAIVALSAGLQLPAPNSSGVTPDSAFGGQMRPWLAQLGDPAVDVFPAQVLLNGLPYYNLQGTNMLALRAALAAAPATASPSAASGGSPSGNFSIAAIASGAGGVLVLEALLIAAAVFLRRRSLAPKRLPARAVTSLRSVRPVASSSAERAVAADAASLEVNPLHLPPAAASRSAGESRAAAAASTRIIVSPLSVVADAKMLAAARASAADGVVNPMHKTTDASGGAQAGGADSNRPLPQALLAASLAAGTRTPRPSIGKTRAASSRIIPSPLASGKEEAAVREADNAAVIPVRAQASSSVDAGTSSSGGHEHAAQRTSALAPSSAHIARDGGLPASVAEVGGPDTSAMAADMAPSPRAGVPKQRVTLSPLSAVTEEAIDADINAADNAGEPGGSAPDALTRVPA